MHSRTYTLNEIINPTTVLDKKYTIPKKIPTSATDNLNYLLRHGTDQQINFIFHLDGFIDEEVLRKTVRLCLDAEPVLGCRYNKEGRQPFWERRNDLDSEEYFSLIVDENQEVMIDDFILGEIDPSHDALIQIRLYRSSDNDKLVIKSDHSVMDGGGFYDFLELFLDIYNKLLQNTHYLVIPNVNAERSEKQVLKHFNIYKKMRSFIKETTSIPKWSFPAIGKGRELKTYSLKKLEKERFNQIKQYGKQRNASINDMILTAFFRALSKINKPKKGSSVVLSIPTDLRVLLPTRKAETISNLASSTFIKIKYNPSETFEQTLRKVSNQTKKKKDILLGLGYIFLIRNIFRIRFSILEKTVKTIYKKLGNKVKMYPIITNIGMIDSKERKFGNVNVIDGYIVTPINWSPSFSMGISSYNKKLSLSIGYCEDSYSKETIELFLELLDNELQL